MAYKSFITGTFLSFHFTGIFPMSLLCPLLNLNSAWNWGGFHLDFYISYSKLLSVQFPVWAMAYQGQSLAPLSLLNFGLGEIT